MADIFEDCKDIFESDKPQFLTLLENHIDLDEIIPFSFYNHYYAATGRNRKFPDASKITRFKQDFLLNLQSVFDKLVKNLFFYFFYLLSELKNRILKTTVL